MPRYTVEYRAFYDRFHTVRCNITRNRLAAVIAFVSGILLLLSGYKATLEIYNLITHEIVLHTAREFWMFLLIPLGYDKSAWRNYCTNRSNNRIVQSKKIAIGIKKENATIMKLSYSILFS